MHRPSRQVLALALLCLAPPALAHAQTATPAAPQTTTPAAQTTAPPAPQTAAVVTASDVDRDVVASESDFVIEALPTTLPLERGKWAVRMTHRFSYAINKGSPLDTGSLTSQFFKNFFGFDSTPAVALEVRVGIWKGAQLAVHRVNERTLEFLGQQQLLRQGAGRGVSIDLVTGVEGHENFSEDFGYTLGAVISHRFGSHGAIYAEPIGVFNSNPFVGGDQINPLSAPSSESNNTFMMGFGTRVRLGKSKTYLVLEGTPRFAGYTPGTTQVGFGIEERVGGHVFQLNFTNGFSTTLRQLASARPPDGVNNWHIGFNLTRKF